MYSIRPLFPPSLKINWQKLHKYKSGWKSTNLILNWSINRSDIKGQLLLSIALATSIGSNQPPKNVISVEVGLCVTNKKCFDEIKALFIHCDCLKMQMINTFERVFYCLHLFCISSFSNSYTFPDILTWKLDPHRTARQPTLQTETR